MSAGAASLFPRCASCRVALQPGQMAVFRRDGRAVHVECPAVFCVLCAREVVRGAPIRRQAEDMIHASCWMKRYRATVGALQARAAAG